MKAYLGKKIKNWHDKILLKKIKLIRLKITFKSWLQYGGKKKKINYKTIS